MKTFSWESFRVTLEPRVGANVSNVAEQLVHLATLLDTKVSTVFNDTPLEATKDTDPHNLVRTYFAKRDA